MTIMWTVDGDIPADDDTTSQVYATEDAAYAAFGRLVLRTGYVTSDWAVIAREVVGTPETRDEPAWPIGTKYPRPWSVDESGDAPMVVAMDGGVVLSVCVGGLTTDEDRDLAAWLVQLVNATAGRG